MAAQNSLKLCLIVRRGFLEPGFVVHPVFGVVGTNDHCPWHSLLPATRSNRLRRDGSVRLCANVAVHVRSGTFLASQFSSELYDYRRVIGMSGLAEDGGLAAVDPGDPKAFDYGSISQHEVDPQTLLVVVEILRIPIAKPNFDNRHESTC